MAKALTAVDLLPRWTKHVVTDSTGRDPLGLSRLSHLITETMIHSIITTTNRARYYSFYCWVLSHIEKTEAPTKYQSFLAAFQRREAFMAMATLVRNAETSPVGVTAVKDRLEVGQQNKEVRVRFPVLPGNELGGYGQYYGGCLYTLGLTCRTDDGIDRVADERGNAIAEAFQASIARTPYFAKEHFKSDTVPFSVLKQSADPFSLDAIQDDAAKEERRLLIELLFGLNAAASQLILFQQQSLAHILHVVDAYQKSKVTITEEYQWMQVIYAPCYYGVIVNEDNVAKPFNVPDALQLCHSFWRQFCAHQYLTLALEHLLIQVLELTGAEENGLSLPEVVERLLTGGFADALEEITGKNCSAPAKLMAAIGINEVPLEDVCRKFKTKYGWGHEFSEEAIWALDAETPAEHVAHAVMMLAVLYAKWRKCSDELALPEFHIKVGNELWLNKVLPPMDSWLSPDASWATVLRDLFRIFILEQHDRVMYEKRRLDSCWISVQDGRWLKQQDYETARRSSRREQAIRILIDLQLLTRSEKVGLSITAEGRSLLRGVVGGGQ